MSPPLNVGDLRPARLRLRSLRLMSLRLGLISALFIQSLATGALCTRGLSAEPAPALKERSFIEQLPELSERIELLSRTYLDPALRSRANRFAIKLTEGRVKYLSEDYRSATQILLELVETYTQDKRAPLYKEGLFYLADSLYHIGNLKSSAERFQELLQLGSSPSRVCALGRLLELSVRLERPDLAARFEREALQSAQEQRDPHILYQLGKYSADKGRHEEAMELWRGVSEDSSVYPQARYLSAISELKLGRTTEALKRFIELKALDLDSLQEARRARDADRLSRGERREQLEELGQSESPQGSRCAFRSQQEQLADVEGWPQVSAEASLSVARLYYELGRYEESTSAYLEVPRGSASFRKAIEESVWVAIKQGLFKEALQRLDIQLIDEPDMLNNPNTRLLQGRLMSTLGRFEDAQSLFSEIRQRFELLKSRDIAPIMRRASGLLPQYFQERIQEGNQALNLESLIPRAARHLITQEGSSSAARSLFVELTTLRRDLELAKEDVKLLRWVLDAPNRAEIFPQIHEGLLRSIELRALLFTIQRQLNERQSASVSSPEYRALHERVERAQEALRGVPMSTLSFNELEAKVEGALLSSDLTLSRIKLTLMNFSAQLTAIKAYLKDLRADDVGQVLSPTERSALLNEAMREEQRVERLAELATQVRDELRKTQLRVGLYDEAFALDEAHRTELYEALSAESAWLAQRQQLKLSTFSQLKRLHGVILDFQRRSLKLVDQNSGDLKAQLALEERHVAEQSRRLDALTKRAQQLGGQIAAFAFYRVLEVIDAYLLESDAGLLDVTWSQKAQRSELLGEEHKKRRVHLKVMRRDLADAPL